MSEAAQAAIEFKKQGNDFLRARQFKEAVDAYSKGINACTEPEIQGPILGNRSQAYRRLGDIDSALDDANQAVKILPSYARGHLRKAYALREMKKWKECQEVVENALEMGLEFKDSDEKNLKILLNKSLQYQQQKKVREKLQFIMGKLAGKWNGAVPPELGGGSQELDFKSETKVVLTVPARQMEATLKLDVSKEPMWLDITIPIPTGPGQAVEHMMPHLFEFNEDYTQLHLMGPPDQGLQPGVPLRRPDYIDKSSKSYVKMSRGPATATEEEKVVLQTVEELKGQSEEKKMTVYCQMMTKKLRDAVAQTGFKFEEPQPHWPDNEIKEKYTSMLKMSQYIFLLEKHFGQKLCTDVANMMKAGPPGFTSPELKKAIEDLREIMIAAGMYKEPAPGVAPGGPPAPANQPTAPEVSPGNNYGANVTGNKQDKKVVSAPRPVTGMNAVSLVFFGAIAATAVMGIAYYLIGGSSRKSTKKK
mmetsp:Transcript_25371/g.61107  ORF Transcript_25371/g.61107 Transcript_25371/m.61107 type:complete len:476 (-) Transcript_25371:192-1619(-)